MPPAPSSVSEPSASPSRYSADQRRRGARPSSRRRSSLSRKNARETSRSSSGDFPEGMAQRAHVAGDRVENRRLRFGHYPLPSPATRASARSTRNVRATARYVRSGNPRHDARLDDPNQPAPFEHSEVVISAGFTAIPSRSASSLAGQRLVDQQRDDPVTLAVDQRPERV